MRRGSLAGKILAIVPISVMIGAMLGGLPMFSEQAEATPVVFYVPDDYTTIQAAVDAAKPGDTVIVRDGTYAENVDVNKDHLTIRSEHGDEVTTVRAANSRDYVFEVSADYVNIDGFMVTGAVGSYSGIHLNNAQHCIVSNHKIWANGYGISINYSNGNNIVNNALNSNVYAGIYLLHSTSNIIQGNTIGQDYLNVSYDNVAVWLDVSASNTFTRNHILNYNYSIFWRSSNNNRAYLNDFINAGKGILYESSTNVWHSPTRITYGYDNNTYTNYLGNYWDDYTGSDADGDGIGDTPYPIDSDADNYPLKEPFENYEMGPGVNNSPKTPSSPWPANHATGVSVNADLSWTGGDADAEDTVTYDVYFGTTSTPPLISSDQSPTSYDLGVLKPNTKYYWKIVATDNHGVSTVGPRWDFTTASAQEKVTLTLYVHENAVSGPIIAGARVTGQDGGGMDFDKTTGSSGYVTITGTPGVWSFAVYKSGYDTNSWSQTIATICERHAYLIEHEEQVPEQPATYLLPPPTLASPVNVAAAAALRPIFSWSSVSGANRYWLVVATNKNILPSDPGDGFYDIYYVPTDTGGQWTTLFYAAYYQSIPVRLYNFDGQAVTPLQSLVISYEEKVSGEGMIYKEITSGQSFSSYQGAQAYVASQTSGNYRIVGTSPLSSPVPLEQLDTMVLVPGAVISEIGLTTTSYTPAVNLGRSTTYWWQVQAFTLENNMVTRLGQHSAQYSFITEKETESPSGPHILDIDPSSGAPGIHVTISGSNFDQVLFGRSVSFGPLKPAAIIDWSDTEILVQVPPGKGTVEVTVSGAGGCSNAVPFTYEEPSIGYVDPEFGEPNTQVTIGGTGFGVETGLGVVTYVEFGKSLATEVPSRWKDDEIVVQAPGDYGTGAVGELWEEVLKALACYASGGALSLLFDLESIMSSIFDLSDNTVRMLPNGNVEVDVRVYTAAGQSNAKVFTYGSPPLEYIHLASPAELRIYDSQGRVTGLVAGEVKQEIPNSAYFDDTIVLLTPSDSYNYEVVGTNDGKYGLKIASIQDGKTVTFAVVDIPTETGVIHQYTIDWEALAEGEQGVEVQIDANGDGIFEGAKTLQPPVASFSFLPSSVFVNDAVEFDASESSDIGGGIVSYQWDFGDGNTSTGEIASHAYPVPGGYLVSLVVMDNDGLVSTCSRTIQVSERQGMPIWGWAIIGVGIVVIAVIVLKRYRLVKR